MGRQWRQVLMSPDPSQPVRATDCGPPSQLIIGRSTLSSTPAPLPPPRHQRYLRTTAPSSMHECCRLSHTDAAAITQRSLGMTSVGSKAPSMQVCVTAATDDPGPAMAAMLHGMAADTCHGPPHAMAPPSPGRSCGEYDVPLDHELVPAGHRRHGPRGAAAARRSVGRRCGCIRNDDRRSDTGGDQPME